MLSLYTSVSVTNSTRLIDALINCLMCCICWLLIVWCVVVLLRWSTCAVNMTRWLPTTRLWRQTSSSGSRIPSRVWITASFPILLQVFRTCCHSSTTTGHWKNHQSLFFKNLFLSCFVIDHWRYVRIMWYCHNWFQWGRFLNGHGRPGQVSSCDRLFWSNRSGLRKKNG